MGCCLTTPNATATATAGDKSKTNSKPVTSPPPGGFEEEETVVKQVLSETPITSKKPPPIQITQLIKQEELIKNPSPVVVEENKAISEEVLSYSSYSASFSAATTTTTTIGIEIDEDGEVNKPMKPKIVTSSTRKVRRTGPSPHPPTSARRTTVQRHRNVGPSNVVRRESLPASRRVLRSPAIREETKQPGQIRRIKGTSTSSVTSSGNRQPIVKVTENKVNVKVRNTTDDVDVMPLQETGESLENPLVSLECFIFL